jgi:phage host-nuclease inhibitor protein Gam
MSKSTSKKKKEKPFAVILIASEDGLVAALNRYVLAKLELARKQARHDEKVAALAAEFDKEVLPLREEILSLEGSVQLYCTAHKDELFTTPKSREYSNAVVGFELNPPKVERIIAGDTFDAIAARLESATWGDPYIDYKGPILAKDALLRDRAELTPEQLQEVGIRFEQSERFFITIKAPSAEGIATTEPAPAPAKEAA